MKEHLLTLFLAITTGITILVFTVVNAPQAVTAFSQDEILFEHPTAQGNIVVHQNAYDEFALSFINRGMMGKSYAGSSYATSLDDTHLLTLTAGPGIPFTSHAVVSSNPELHQVIIMESGFQIAHGSHAKRTSNEDLAVFLVSSVDLTGNDVLVVGFDVDGAIIWEIAIP